MMLYTHGRPCALCTLPLESITRLALNLTPILRLAVCTADRVYRHFVINMQNKNCQITEKQQMLACRLQDNTEANIRTFVFWSLDGNYGSKWCRKILTDEYSGRIHVSSVLQLFVFYSLFTEMQIFADCRIAQQLMEDSWQLLVLLV